MKVVLISDIHANAYYFSKVLKKIEEEKADRLICLGDLVGYYDEPNSVIELCKSNNVECLKGNHEEYLLRQLKYNEAKEKLYRINCHRESLTPENFQFIEQLSKDIIVKYKKISLYCTHAIPDNTIKYIFSPNEIEQEYFKGYNYYCSGHTHIPYVQYNFGTCLINPGSIGQPRDYTTHPSYAVINFDKNEVSIKKIQIDKDDYFEQLRIKNFDKALIDILKRT